MKDGTDSEGHGKEKVGWVVQVRRRHENIRAVVEM